MDPITIFILKLIFGPIIIGIVITLVEITLKKIEDYLRKLRTKKHLVRNAILVKKMLPNGKFRIAAGFLKDDPRISLRTGRAPNGLETKVVVLNSDDPEQK